MGGCREEVLLSVPLQALTYSSSNSNNNTSDKRFFGNLSARERELVCVTSGNSYFGLHLVKELLGRGYLTRVTIQHPEDMEELKRQTSTQEMRQLESVVVAKMGDPSSLCGAFSGCHVIFHTSSFLDPHGLSGYTERTAFLEMEGARNVIEACARASYVKRCVFTSSLLASIWTRGPVDERSWSDEDFCIQNKLWMALGKTRAEKMAWRKAREMKVKLLTVSPGLLVTPSSLPFLKGGREMLKQGKLATSDVKQVAKAHVQVYEAMDSGACGRHFCYERTLKSISEAILLENSLKIKGFLVSSDEDYDEEQERIESGICSSRLQSLLSSLRFSCFSEVN